MANSSPSSSVASSSSSSSSSSMSSFFRSEAVSLCHVYVQNEMAFDIVAELGQLGE